MFVGLLMFTPTLPDWFTYSWADRLALIASDDKNVIVFFIIYLVIS